MHAMHGGYTVQGMLDMCGACAEQGTLDRPRGSGENLPRGIVGLWLFSFCKVIAFPKPQDSYFIKTSVDCKKREGAFRVVNIPILW